MPIDHISNLKNIPFEQRRQRLDEILDELRINPHLMTAQAIKLDDHYFDIMHRTGLVPEDVGQPPFMDIDEIWRLGLGGKLVYVPHSGDDGTEREYGILPNMGNVNPYGIRCVTEIIRGSVVLESMIMETYHPGLFDAKKRKTGDEDITVMDNSVSVTIMVPDFELDKFLDLIKSITMSQYLTTKEIGEMDMVWRRLGGSTTLKQSAQLILRMVRMHYKLDLTYGHSSIHDLFHNPKSNLIKRMQRRLNYPSDEELAELGLNWQDIAENWEAMFTNYYSERGLTEFIGGEG